MTGGKVQKHSICPNYFEIFAFCDNTTTRQFCVKAFVSQLFDFIKMGAIKEISSTVYSTQRFDRFGGFLVYFPWSSIFGEGRGKLKEGERI